VQLFFQNGGNDCYIVRLIGSGGQLASIILKNEDKRDVLEFTAKESGIQGNELALQIDYDTPFPEDTFNLHIYQIANDGKIVSSEEFLNCSMKIDSPRYTPSLVTQNSDLVKCTTTITDNDYESIASYSESRLPIPNVGSPVGGRPAWINNLGNLIKDNGNKTTSKFQISIDDSKFFEIDLKNAIDPSIIDENGVTNKLNNILDTTIQPPYSGKVEVIVKDGPKDGPSQSKILRFKSKGTSKVKSIIIKPGSSNDVTKTLMLGTDNGGIERSSYGFFRPAPNGISFKITDIDDLAGIPQNTLQNITIDSNPIDFGKKLQTSGNNSTEPWYKDKNGSFDGVREKNWNYCYRNKF